MPRTPEQMWQGIAESELARPGVTAGGGFGRAEGLRGRLVYPSLF